MSFDASGASGAPASDLPPGILFWRAYGRTGGATGQTSTPTWELTVGALSAPVSTSWGTTLDVNGDGFADVIVGAPDADPNAVGIGAGAALVYHGGPSGLGASPAATLAVPGAGQFGCSVASAGDVNGDGYADLIIGSKSGSEAFVYLGGPAGVAASPAATLVSPDGSLDWFGWSVASAGDVNGDGYADVLVGTGPPGAGSVSRAYLYLGAAGGIASTPAAKLVGPDGGAFGMSVASAGDVNGDGYADIIVGATVGTGRAYLYLGGASGIGASPTVTLVGPGGQVGAFGGGVSSAGDVNGDGYADVIVAAPGSGVSTGYALLYLGGAAGLASTPALTLSGPGGNDQFGFSVAAAGDVDGDGYADVVVGAPSVASATGGAYIFLGSASAGLASTPMVTLIPPKTAGRFGYSVSGAGDVNGDGYADVVVGAYYASQAYVYLSGKSGFAATPAATISGTGGVGNAVATLNPVCHRHEARRGGAPYRRTRPRTISVGTNVAGACASHQL